MPIIDYFQAGCLDENNNTPQENSYCNLEQTSVTSTTITYQIWVGKPAHLYWRTFNASSSVTVTKYINSQRQAEAYPNQDGERSPTLPQVYPVAAVQTGQQFILTAYNAAGAETSYSLIFAPIVRPAAPPYGINLVVVSGGVGGPSLGLRLEWKYNLAALNSIVGFRIKHTYNYAPQPDVNLLFAPPVNYSCADPAPGSDEVTCTYTFPVFTAPGTCGRKFMVAALYQDLNDLIEDSDYTMEVTIDSCPGTNQ